MKTHFTSHEKLEYGLIGIYTLGLLALVLIDFPEGTKGISVTITFGSLALLIVLYSLTARNWAYSIVIGFSAMTAVGLFFKVQRLPGASEILGIGVMMQFVFPLLFISTAWNYRNIFGKLVWLAYLLCIMLFVQMVLPLLKVLHIEFNPDYDLFAIYIVAMIGSHLLLMRIKDVKLNGFYNALKVIIITSLTYILVQTIGRLASNHPSFTPPCLLNPNSGICRLVVE